MAGYGSDDDDDLFLALQNMEPCANCGKPGARTPCMSGCNLVYYCSQECMMNNASAHRLRCRNLRCSKFNDSDDSESDSAYETFSDDSAEESDEEEAHSSVSAPVKAKAVPVMKPAALDTPKKKKDKGGKKKSGKKKRDSVDSHLSVSSETEKRIEEKIMRRLRQQEENRIALAIEQRMKEEHANWKGEEMNRIAMEVKRRLQEEQMKNEAAEDNLLQTMSKSKVLDEPAQERLKKKVENKFRRQGTTMPITQNPPEVLATADAPKDEVPVVKDVKEWTNSSAALHRLKIAVWKDGELGLGFIQNPLNSDFTMVGQVKGAESVASRAKITRGDILLSVNGESVKGFNHPDLMSHLDEVPKPAILKFESANVTDIGEYVVKWINGPLGLTLKDDGSPEALPVVHRLTRRPGSTAQKAHVAIGDILVAINNIDTVALGCTLAMSVLKKVQLPAKLRFRGVGGKPSNPVVAPSSTSASSDVEGSAKPTTIANSVVSSPNSDDRPSLRDTTTSSRASYENRRPIYDIIWTEGPLGLTIIPGEAKGDLPVVKRVTGKGTSSGLEFAQVGDRLAKLNAESMEGVPFEDVVYKLKNIARPVTLVMKASKNALGVAEPSRSPSASGTSVEVQKSSIRSSVPTVPFSNAHEEYEIVWGDGPLGLTIDSASNSRTYIKRLSKRGAAAALHDSAIGDQLIEINNIDVSAKQFSDVVQMLKVVSKPAILRFRPEQLDRPSSFSANATTASESSKKSNVVTAALPKEKKEKVPLSSTPANKYELCWESGPLGMSLHAGETIRDFPYVNRLTGTGCAGHLSQSSLGDKLIAINGRSIEGESFNSVMQNLKVFPKPIYLQFQSESSFGVAAPPPPSRNSGPPRSSDSSYAKPPPPISSNPIVARAAGVARKAAEASAARLNQTVGHRSSDLEAAPRSIQRSASGGAQRSSDLDARSYHRPQSSMPASAANRAANNIALNSVNQRPPTTQNVPRPNEAAIPSAAPGYESQTSSSAATAGATTATTALQRADSGGDKFSQLHTPFLGGPKLSSGRRQKIVQSVKK